MTFDYIVAGAGSAVRARSADPAVPPEIKFNFLRSDYDMRALIRDIRVCRAIAARPALAPWIAEEILPGAAAAADADLEQVVRERGVSNHHPAGTRRMGPDRAALVVPRPGVYGVDGLRAADASIMPAIIAGDVNAPTIVIGKKPRR